MTVIDLLSRDPKGQRAQILALASVAGLSNAIALMVINKAAQAPETANAKTFLLFALVVAVFFFSARWTSRWVNEAIERALHTIKTRLVEKIGRADLAGIERIGASEILDRVTENVTIISASATQLGSVLQSICIFVFGALYLFWLSPAAFAILCPLQLFALYLFRSWRSLTSELLREHGKSRLDFLDRLMDLLKGAKEVKLSRARSRDVLDDFQASSASLRDLSAKTNQVFDNMLVFMNCNLYVLLAALVFVLPKHVAVDAQTLSKLVSAVLFVWGSVQVGLFGYSAYVQSNQALDQIEVLEDKLDRAAGTDVQPEVERDPWAGKPGRIEVSGIEYEYPSESGGDAPFHIGPIELTIEPGEVLFIVGGNGSGKSTFLKVLTGLYSPTRGVLRVNDVVVKPENTVAYREMFSTIFSDFHLFSKVYGLLDVDVEAVQELLREMHIEHKTTFQGGQFTRRNLSTGQKKRLAMVLALLEERPIMVLDEWAADQDPEFRQYFYESMLPTLKRRGKTLIVVSHDDRYFHCGDRVAIMDYGKVRTIQTNRHAPPAQEATAEEG